MAMEAIFASPLDVRRDGRNWILNRPLLMKVWQYDQALPDFGTADVVAPQDIGGARYDVACIQIRVPAGFLTDFASVPRWPLTHLLAGDTAHMSAVVHDYLYLHRAERAWADAVFLAAMRAERIPAWRRWLMWAAVRAAGWRAYRGG